MTVPYSSEYAIGDDTVEEADALEGTEIVLEAIQPVPIAEPSPISP